MTGTTLIAREIGGKISTNPSGFFLLWVKPRFNAKVSISEVLGLGANRGWVILKTRAVAIYRLEFIKSLAIG